MRYIFVLNIICILLQFSIVLFVYHLCIVTRFAIQYLTLFKYLLIVFSCITVYNRIEGCLKGNQFIDDKTYSYIINFRWKWRCTHAVFLIQYTFTLLSSIVTISQLFLTFRNCEIIFTSLWNWEKDGKIMMKTSDQIIVFMTVFCNSLTIRIWIFNISLLRRWSIKLWFYSFKGYV